MIQRLRKFFSLKRIIIFITVSGLFSVVALYFADKKIAELAAEKTYHKAEDIPHNRVGLILGTSKTTCRGRINQYFAHRIKAATTLYKAGKIDYIL
jgi:SanA protein